MVLFDTEGTNDHIDGVAYGNPSLAELSIVAGGLCQQSVAEHLLHGELAKTFFYQQSFRFRSGALEHFEKYQVTD